MDTKDKYLSQYKAGKKEQYAARCAFFLAGFTINYYMGTNDTSYQRTFTNW